MRSDITIGCGMVRRGIGGDRVCTPWANYCTNPSQVKYTARTHWTTRQPQSRYLGASPLAALHTVQLPRPPDLALREQHRAAITRRSEARIALFVTAVVDHSCARSDALTVCLRLGALQRGGDRAPAWGTASVGACARAFVRACVTREPTHGSGNGGTRAHDCSRTTRARDAMHPAAHPTRLTAAPSGPTPSRRWRVS